LKRVEACRGSHLQARSLRIPSYQQFAVEHRGRAERFSNIGEAPRNIVARPAVEPGLAARMNELDADPIPLPFGGELFERDLRLFEGMCEHERAKHGYVSRGRLLAAPLSPVEELGERWAETMPDLFHGIEFKPECLRQRLFGEACIDPHPELPERELQQCEPPGSVKMIEHPP